MSLNWRDRLRNRTAHQLGISQEDLNYVWENIGDFCDESDRLFKQTMKKDLTHKEIDDCVDKLTDAEFDQMSNEVIINVLARHGKKRKRTNYEVESDQDYENIRESQGKEMFEERSQPMEQRIPA